MTTQQQSVRASVRSWNAPLVLRLFVGALVTFTAIVGPTAARGAAADVPQWRTRLASQYKLTDLGCSADDSAAGLQAFFAEALGPIVGHDSPRIIRVGGGLNVWLLQDTFVDYTGQFHTLDKTYYSNNSMVIEYRHCFTMVRNTASEIDSTFEEGVGKVDFDRYFWPLGGMVVGDKLQIFWTEIVRDKPVGGPLDGVSLHPNSTWLATYDLHSLAKLDFRPAPNPGVSPIYGFGVGSQGAWTYLFGNTFQQNLAREGGFGNGPHSGTAMWLARVPYGQLLAEPQYWNGNGWSSSPAAAVPFSQRNFVENAMLPVFIGGRWFSATKVDGFTGSTMTIDVAPHPWGPWTTVETLPSTPRGDPTGTVTYHAIVLPWTDPSGGLIISLSQVPPHLGATDAPARYRPNYFVVSITAQLRQTAFTPGRRWSA